MIIILTGGIGCGKSMVSQLLKVMGYAVYDCDSRAKVLMNTNTQLRLSLEALLGKETYQTADGSLNRSFVASRIFQNRKLLAQINALVHPAVAEEIRTEAAQTSLLFVESAIYYESGFSHLIPADQVWCIAAPLDLRIARAMQRDQATQEKVMARINSQISQEEKIKKADATLWNDSTHSLIEQVNQLLISLFPTFTAIDAAVSNRQDR
ncbi:MAG: dephospho-CoA kinase [Bacteroidales bacterium]|nr:dephospho-CoA kinase [Bacteroidales bacterium]